MMDKLDLIYFNTGKKEGKEETIKAVLNITQLMGIILISSIVGLNLLFSFAYMEYGYADFLDSFGWGFITGMILVAGLFMLGMVDKK